VVVTGRDRARGDAVVAGDRGGPAGSAHFVAADLGDEQATTQMVEDAAFA